MSSTVAFQTNGLGSLFQCSAQTVMAWVRSATEVNTPRRRRLSVNSLNQRSIRFNQELEVGVKCRCQRRRSLCANHLRTSGVLCADRLSRITWTDRPRGTWASICLKNASTSFPACPLRRWVWTCPVPTFIAAEDLGFTAEDIQQRLRYEPLSSFRSTYAYTNFGMTAGADAVAAAAGTDWATLSEQTLYGPLGMTSTSSRFDDYTARTNRAWTHIQQNGAWTAAVV